MKPISGKNILIETFLKNHLRSIVERGGDKEENEDIVICNGLSSYEIVSEESLMDYRRWDF